jgi:hypothetical protein
VMMCVHNCIQTRSHMTAASELYLDRTEKELNKYFNST